MKKGISKLGYIKRTYYEYEGGIGKSVRRSPFGIERLAQWWQTMILRDRFFYPILTKIIDSFSCPPLNAAFLYFKKRFPEVHEQAEISYNMMMLFLHKNDATSLSTCGHSFFIFLTCWYGVCKIEFSQMGKTVENWIWCARKDKSNLEDFVCLV